MSCQEGRNLREEGWLWCCFLGKLLQLNFAALRTPDSLEIQLPCPGKGTKGLGKRVVYTQVKETAKVCVCSEKRPWKNSLWGCMWLSSPGASRSDFLARK